ncbi:MAG: hypothetical protein RIE08_06550 [Acidimicrobiales bacterium]
MKSLWNHPTDTVAHIPVMHHAEFEARFAECARYLIVSVAAAGEVTDPHLRVTTIDAIARLARPRYKDTDLERDLGDACLDLGLWDALGVVAGDLDPIRRDGLLRAAVGVAWAGRAGPSAAQSEIIVAAATALGLAPLRARLMVSRPMASPETPLAT